MEKLVIVGKPFPRIDGVVQASGTALYASDITLPGMLHGKVLRSRFPHARLLRLDTVKAEKASGVKAVVTVRDTAKVPYSLMAPAYADKLVFADAKVRNLWDEVAAVAAIDEETAEAALSLIEAEYEELPAVFDPGEAMKPEAPKIHEVENNILCHPVKEEGDVEKGFREADLVYEDTSQFLAASHCCMETHCAVASFDVRGNLTLYTSTQAPYYVRWDLARVLGMPLEKIRIMKVHVGGGFGSKSRIKEVDAIAALLAKKSGRPVKLWLDRSDEFAGTKSRHAMTIKLKSGVKKDGTLLALEGKIIVDLGAYNDIGQEVTQFMHLAGPYLVPNFKREGFAVYTNNNNGGRFRGFAGPAECYALETHLNFVAKELGLDPLEFRLKNAKHKGEIIEQGRLLGYGLDVSLSKAASLMGRGQQEKEAQAGHLRRGLGLACSANWGTGNPGDVSSAFVRIADNGKITVLSGVTEIGGGQDTAMAQMAAETLSVSVEDIRMVTMDTDATPIDLGSRASRCTFMAGHAVKLAAVDARRELLKLAAKKLEVHENDLGIEMGRVYVKGSPDRALSFAQVVEGPGATKLARAVLGKGYYDRDETLGRGAKLFCGYSTHVAEVEVDTQTGQVQVLRLVAASDMGRAINPLAVEGQLQGGAGQGLGYALSEGLARDSGNVTNKTFSDYRIPCASDAPQVHPILIEPVNPYGPYGAHGVGEPASLPTAAAIGNAIYDAVGVRIMDLPITAEKVLKALKARSSAGL